MRMKLRPRILMRGGCKKTAINGKGSSVEISKMILLAKVGRERAWMKGGKSVEENREPSSSTWSTFLTIDLDDR